MIISHISHAGYESISKRLKPVVAFFNNLIQRIYRAALSVFSKIISWKSVPGFFSQREITLIQEMNALRFKQATQSSLNLSKREIEQLKIEQVPPEIALLDNCKEPGYVCFDKSLEDFRAFLRDFCCLFVDILYESEIAKWIDSAQNMASSLPGMIKSFATLLIEVGDKAVKPIFQKLSEQKSTHIDPSLKAIFRVLIRPDPFLLREELSSYLEEKLKEYSLSNNKDNKGDNLTNNEDYILPVFQYVNSQKSSKSIYDFYSTEKKYNDDLLQKLKNDAVQFWEKKVTLERSELYLELERELSNEFRVCVPSKNLKDLITPTLTWLILSDHSMPLVEILEASPQSQSVTFKILERCLELLIHRKINQYSLLIERTLQKNLEVITAKTLHINAQRIADFFSEKVALLISSSSFSEKFDLLVHEVILPHIKGINEAQKLTSEHSVLIEKAKHAIEMSSQDLKNAEIQTKAKDYLEWINSRSCKETFLQNILIDKYSQQPICTKKIAEVIDAEITLAGTVPDLLPDALSLRSSKEKAVYSEITEEILDLIIPMKKNLKADRVLETIDPFDELWERLYFPEEFQEIINNLSKTAEEFINPETASLFEIIKTPAIEIIKNIFKLYSKELLRKQLTNLVEISFREVADPEHLIELFSLNLLPLINKKLVQLLIGQHFARNLAQFTPFIHTLLIDDPSNHEANLHTLQAAIIKEFKSTLNEALLNAFYISEATDVNDNDIKIVHSPFTEEDWLSIIHPLVLTYEEAILNSNADGSAFDASISSPLEIKGILQKYFQTTSKENDEVYGEIFIELLFKSGNLPNETLISYFIKDATSREITTGLAPIRAGHEYLVNVITSSLKANLLNKQYCKYLLSDIPTAKPKYVEEKLKSEIKITAELAHELILKAVEQKGAAAAFAVKKYMTEKPDKITHLINKIFNDLFRNYLVNANLIAACCQKLFRNNLKSSTYTSLQ